MLRSVRGLRLPLAVAALALTAPLVASAAAGHPASAPAATSVTSVSDIQIPVDGQQPLPAYLVLPRRGQHAGGGHRAPAVLFLHWFDPPLKDSDRTEFLAEAVRLADRGVVSLLPQQRFPWAGDPVGDARDRATIDAQLAALQEALDALQHRPEVDPQRVAIVGHDYGAMYGLDLAARNPQVTAVVAMAADATWSNWFDKFWLGLEGEAEAAYARLFADIDPVVAAHAADSRPLYLQWSATDFYIPQAVRDAFSAAAPHARVSVYDHVDHQLGVRALTDRDAWLLDVLSTG
jgi:dienelactone hydrolase